MAQKSATNSGLRGPGPSPGPGYCVVFWSKKVPLYILVLAIAIEDYEVSEYLQCNELNRGYLTVFSQLGGHELKQNNLSLRSLRTKFGHNLLGLKPITRVRTQAIGLKTRILVFCHF